MRTKKQIKAEIERLKLMHIETDYLYDVKDKIALLSNELEERK